MARAPSPATAEEAAGPGRARLIERRGHTGAMRAGPWSSALSGGVGGSGVGPAVDVAEAPTHIWAGPSRSMSVASPITERAGALDIRLPTGASVAECFGIGTAIACGHPVGALRL